MIRILLLVSLVQNSQLLLATESKPNIIFILADDLGVYAEREGWSELQKTYAAMITRLDSDVGELLSLRKEMKIDENTLILFSGDNGSAQDEDGAIGKFFDESMGGK